MSLMKYKKIWISTHLISLFIFLRSLNLFWFCSNLEHKFPI